MSDRRITIGSRGSQLALWQSQSVKSFLQKHYPDIFIEIHVIKTKGDIIQDTSLAKIGDKGLFTKEIENALLNEEIDLAVHSLKDIPTELPSGLTVGAVLARENPQDAFVSFKHKQFDDLPRNAIMATSSLRRRANILHLRPDIRLVDSRGNVVTRLRKLKDLDYDAMILAAAGLQRLGYTDAIREILPPEKMLPAVSQGAIGIEIRNDDGKMRDMLRPLHDEQTHVAIVAERAFLRELEGGCQVPIGALAQLQGTEIILQGFIANLAGKNRIHGKVTGQQHDAENVGIRLAKELLNRGGRTILNEIYDEQKV